MAQAMITLAAIKDYLSVWQIPPLLAVIGLIIFLVMYRRRQM